MFGTKKIYAKIMNGKLVVRVGGGFMGIDEFIQTYGESELLKIQRFTPEQIENLHTPTEVKNGAAMVRYSTVGKSPRVSTIGGHNNSFGSPANT